MKKLLLTMMFCAIGFAVFAQTDFRSLSFDEAIATAKQENKMIFIDFYTDWCGPCKVMAQDVFPQKEVGDYFNDKFICVKYNAEKEGKELAKRFQVKAYPTFLVLNTQEEVLLDIKGSMSGDKFIAKIEDGLDPNKSPERMKERYQSGERSPELINSYALYMMEQGEENEGFTIVNEYFDSLTDKERTSEANVFLYTRYTLNLDDPKAHYLIKHRNNFGSSQKEVIYNKIDRLYNAAVIPYFSGYLLHENKFQEKDYYGLKKEIQELKLENADDYATKFRIIEGRLNSNDEAFFALCKKEFNNLSTSDKNLLILNLTRLIETKDKTLLKEISQFIRSQLSQLDTNTISLSARLLETIESEIKG